MVERLLSRTAFGKRLAEHSIWEQRIAEARTSLEMTRLLCLKAAAVRDKLGAKAAQAEIATIKVAGPQMALKIASEALQAHGGAGVADEGARERADAKLRNRRTVAGAEEVHNSSEERRMGKEGGRKR